MFAISRTGIHRNPEIQKSCMRSDRLLQFIRLFSQEKKITEFEERVGWAFAAWTRLPYEERPQASYERHSVAAVLEAEDYRRLDDFVAPMLPTFCAET